MSAISHVLTRFLAIGTLAATITSAAMADGGKINFAYSAGFLTDPFQAVLVANTLKTAEEAGMQVLPASNANGDAGKQISDVRNLLAAGAQAMVVIPTDSQAVIPALAAATQKGVPVVTVDTAPAGGKVAMIVRADNSRMGEDACKVIGAAIGGKGTVLSLMGDQATTNGRDRTTGFNNCVKANFPGIKIIEKPTYWKTEKATAAAQTVVNSTPGLSAIYMQSDSVMLAGVLSVLKNAKKLQPVGAKSHIFLTSIDGTPLALKRIRENMLDASISQPLDLYVKYGVDYAKAAFEGKKFTEGPTDHNSTIVKLGDNLMDLLPAPIVTSQNVDDPQLWGNAAGK